MYYQDLMGRSHNRFIASRILLPQLESDPRDWSLTPSRDPRDWSLTPARSESDPVAIGV